MNILVKYGIETMPKHTPTSSLTIGELITDWETKSALGFGDNVRALINGVEQPNSSVIPDGATVVIETRANSKAAWTTAMALVS